MDLVDKLKDLSSRKAEQLKRINTEEATKNAMVLPFLQALGYNVFDPREVVPEFTADVGTKKGEKVDYAIVVDKAVVMLIECKAATIELKDIHKSQLYRYFSVTKAKIAILTNGIIYRFYSDLDEPNKMDDRPFLECDLFKIREPVVEELKKLTRDGFDIDEIMSTAGDLKYTKEIKRVLAEEMAAPSVDLVRMVTSRVSSLRFTKGVKEQFTVLTRRAFRDFVNDLISERLTSALKVEEESARTDTAKVVRKKGAIVTTPEEIEGYHIVKAIIREVVDPSRVVMRDQLSYCGILLDDNNRKPVCRLRFNTANKQVGVFDESKNEECVPIRSLNDIYSLADRLKATAKGYPPPR